MEFRSKVISHKVGYMSLRTSNLLILVVAVLNGSNVHGGLVREDEAARGEVLVTGDKNGVQHGLVQQEVAHPLRDDDIDVLNRQDDLLHLALDQGNDVVQVVVLDNLASIVDNVRHVNLTSWKAKKKKEEPNKMLIA